MMFPPARRRFSRTKPLRMTFPPVEGGGRKSLSVGARSKDTPRTDPSTVSCVLLRRTCLRRTPTHYIRSAHQGAGRAVYFTAAKYGKAGRPPGVAPLVAVRGLVPSGCIAGSQEVRIIILAGGRHVALILLGDSWVPQNVVGAPPIHFGREDGVERTLLRVACQSETFLASPWQGGIDIRILWHIGCQSEFEECFRRTTRISFMIYRHTGFSPVH